MSEIQMSRGLAMSPADRKARAQQKRDMVLAWLAVENWSVFSVLQSLLGVSYPTVHALMKRMEGEGLTRSRALFVPCRQGVTRMVLHGLTAHGVAMAMHVDDARPGSPWEPSKIGPSHVMHQILTQEAHLKALADGWTQWRPSRAMADMGLAKIPDADGLSPEGLRVAIEVERFLKTAKRYEAILGAYVFEIRNRHWDRVDYLCPSREFAERIAASFGSLQRLRLERRGQMTRSAAVEPGHLARFRFYWEEWPVGRYAVANCRGAATS